MKGIQMREAKWQIFTVALCLGVILAISLSPKKGQKQIADTLVGFEGSEGSEELKEIEIETFEEKIYNIGYSSGQKAMLLQMGRPELIDKKAEYTVNFEIPEEERERLDEIRSKAYVDGYHKAGDLFICPRACPY
jgi:hypothetical protein